MIVKYLIFLHLLAEKWSHFLLSPLILLLWQITGGPWTDWWPAQPPVEAGVCSSPTWGVSWTALRSALLTAQGKCALLCSPLPATGETALHGEWQMPSPQAVAPGVMDGLRASTSLAPWAHGDSLGPEMPLYYLSVDFHTLWGNSLCFASWGIRSSWNEERLNEIWSTLINISSLTCWREGFHRND